MYGRINQMNGADFEYVRTVLYDFDLISRVYDEK